MSAKFASYAGLGPFQTPLPVENLMRGIGRVYSGSRILRTSGGLGGDGCFENGATIHGGLVEAYSAIQARDWAVQMVEKLVPDAAKYPEGYKRRAAACISAVLGMAGDDPVQELLVWLDPKRSGVQYWAVLAAQQNKIPVHNLADKTVQTGWKEWLNKALAAARP